MSVSVLDPLSFAATGAPALTSNFTVNPYSRRMLLAFYAGKSNAAFNDPTPAAGNPTFAGLPMTAVPLFMNVNDGAGINWVSYILYLLDPPLGTGLFSLQTVGGNSYKAVTLAMASGVNQAAPFGVPIITGAIGPQTSDTILPASSDGETVIDAIGIDNPFTTPGTPIAPSVVIGTVTAGGAVPLFGGASQRAGGALSSMGWTWAPATAYYPHLAVAIKPQVETYRRPVEYTYDIWEANPQVRDAAGRVVPPQQVRSNRWMRLLGAGQPTSERPLSFVDDDELAYIESVRYDGGSGQLSIQTNRGEFGEIVVAKAAGKSTA